MKYPLIKEINYQNPQEIFKILAHQNGMVFLDSAKLMENCGRYSFLAWDPFQTLVSKNEEIYLNSQLLMSDPFQILAQELKRFSLDTHDDLPPFQGGVAGFFSYDLYQHLEKIHAEQADDMQFPDMALGFYDVVIGFDHECQRAWIFSSGFPLQKGEERETRAKQRLTMALELIHQPVLEDDDAQADISVASHFSQEKYCEAVQKVKDYILAGDIFEANISQRFSADLPEDFSCIKLYLRLREINPATFAAYVALGDAIIASASPERFLKLSHPIVESRPIKGTRPRGKTLQEDQHYAHELQSSIKDRAENIMIVDLLRNDLSRVCEDHSVKVPQLCGLESYATVHHLVSVVTGKLRKTLGAVDLLRASFPGGSITGAPKVRALEIIAEIEPTRRGPYCGSVGYIGFNGNMDTSIVIRTYAIKNNKLTFQTGGAVVADSDPLQEYEETLTKASALLKTLKCIPRGLKTKNRHKILLIDNYDSFVFNLARYVGELGYERMVKRNDAVTLDDIAALQPSHIIISPGPCAPDQAGISIDVIRKFGAHIPILGVCLGHQAIGQVYGGKVVRAKYPMHGKTSIIQHNGAGIFNGLKNPLSVARYHSLIVTEEDLPDELQITARCPAGEIMGLAHQRDPVYGVQFHPESILTESGHDLLENFMKI